MRTAGTRLELALAQARGSEDIVARIVPPEPASEAMSNLNFSNAAIFQRCNKRLADGIHALVSRAMFSPKILDLGASGDQPINLTTDYLLKTGFPIIWSEQRKMLENQ